MTGEEPETVYKTPENGPLPPVRWWRSRPFLIAIVVMMGLAAMAAVLTIRAYRRLSQEVDAQLERGAFAKTVNFYAAPDTISVGDTLTSGELEGLLRRAGYEVRGGSTTTAVRDHGEPDWAFTLDRNIVKSIRDLRKNTAVSEAQLPAPLISNISDKGRQRRVILHFRDLPEVLIRAVTSAEDKHFFQHGGYDPMRILKAAYVDTKSGRKEQGASTISMQLARNLYLDSGKRWSRKGTELLITLHLEHALTKQQIFEYYANQVYLGGYGTYSVNGFGEAAHAYFNEDVRDLSLPQAAMLAGLIQRPSYFRPFQHPDRMTERRNVVLRLMHVNGYIGDDELEQALAAPLGLSAGMSEVSNTQYAIDFASDEFDKIHESEDLPGVRNVQTSIDLRLQTAAEAAIGESMARIDKLLAKHVGKDGKPCKAQVALIALDPRTGEIKAVVGGRDYSASQLDRVMAKRPPGSIFKPFVYAAAMRTALDGSETVLTPSSTVDDTPTVFQYEGQTYKPNNFKGDFHGTVTLRQALAKSMNVAAVKVAQEVGFQNVVSLAKEAGINEDLRPTPSIALGAYEVTPYEMARAYTLFANDGELIEPSLVSRVSDQSGNVEWEASRPIQRVLDSRVNYLMVDMMQDVLKYGTAAGVRSRGFLLPAAGKTGTSHDGWFAGFTSQLLCIVWVGFDDYSELGLEGAKSALPVWTSFMMKASHYKRYRDAKVFTQPDGIVTAAIDPSTGMRPTGFCPWQTVDHFIDGTEPKELCMKHQTDAIPVLPPGGGESTSTASIIPTAFISSPQP